MTMRSMPPVSSHLAERPVPAPPPMIRSPTRDILWNLSSRARRSNRGIGRAPRLRDGAEMLDQCIGELRIVDIPGKTDQPARRRLAHHSFERREQRGIGGGIVEGLARRIDERHSAFRNDK